jgi:hypothetical protein
MIVFSALAPWMITVSAICSWADSVYVPAVRLMLSVPVLRLASVTAARSVVQTVVPLHVPVPSAVPVTV